MKKPYLIIHTHTSIDGKINSMDSPKWKATTRQYRELSLDPEKNILNVDGYLNGRKTTDDNRSEKLEPDLDKNAPLVDEDDFVAIDDALQYYVSIDPSGKLAWPENEVDYGNVKSHIISVITKKASNAYKDYLRRNNVSYIIAGDETIDKELTLFKLKELFGMERIMIGGGGTLNWSFLQDGLVDEVSIVIGPFANGDFDMPGLFKAVEPYSKIDPVTFSVKDVQILENDVVWLRYTVDNKSIKFNQIGKAEEDKQIE